MIAACRSSHCLSSFNGIWLSVNGVPSSENWICLGVTVSGECSEQYLDLYAGVLGQPVGTFQVKPLKPLLQSTPHGCSSCFHPTQILPHNLDTHMMFCRINNDIETMNIATQVLPHAHTYIPEYLLVKALWNDGAAFSNVSDKPSWKRNSCMDICDGQLSVMHTVGMLLPTVCDPCAFLIPGHCCAWYVHMWFK